MYRILITLTICLFAFQGMAQSIDRQVISSYGLLTPTTSSTLGEVVTETKTVSGSFTINQGFQQSQKSQNTSIKELSSVINYSLSPNPTTNFIYLYLETEDEVEFKIQILNNVGQKVSVDRLFKFNKTTTENIDVSHFDSGIYFLVIKDSKQNEVQTIKFLKN